MSDWDRALSLFVTVIVALLVLTLASGLSSGEQAPDLVDAPDATGTGTTR